MHMRGIKRFRKNRFFPRQKSVISLSECTAAFKEIYGVKLDERDQALYGMIGRYRDQVSPHLIDVRNKLRAKGEWAAKEFMQSLVRAKNPWLSVLPKEDGWSGKYIPVPLKF